mgnify:CR=1 FL=1
MRTKGKLLVCGLIFVSGAVLNLFFSTAVHGLLTRKITRLSLLPCQPVFQPPTFDAVPLPARICVCAGRDVLSHQYAAL